ncbi:MAG: hypothetical protein QME64_01715, partial [bacterium]|nr:hypothetical protein [bacterium]
MITQIKIILLSLRGVKRRSNPNLDCFAALAMTKTTMSGFTFIEILAVVVTVGIITLLSFLAFQGKRDETKKTAAYQEMKQMADAEKEVEAYYGYFVPLAVLNDVPGPSGDYVTLNPDCVGNGGFSYNYWLIDPETGHSGNNVAYPSSIRQIRDLFPTDDKARKWRGPFISYQRITTQNPVAPRPVDPWGNDYRLFTWQYQLNYDGSFGAATFGNFTVDRFAIVSLGKNGWLDLGGDDIIYTFK